MSLYRVLTHDPGQVAEVGYSAEFPGYWVAVYAGDDLVTVEGTDGELPTLYHLVSRTWGFVAWTNERSTLLRLRDDPWIDEVNDDSHPGVRELFVSTFASGVPA